MGIIVPAAILLPVTAAVIRKKYWQPPERLIFVYLMLSGVFNILAAALAARSINNLPLLHLYTVIEFTVIAAFFRSIVEPGRARMLITWLMGLFPLMALINIYLLDSIFLYNLIPRSVEAIIVVSFCIYYLMKSLSFSAGKSPFFNFAVVVSFLLYFSGSLALFALSDFIIANKKINALIWNTHATFVLIMYLIIAVAYYKTKHEK
ncbi:hypothetical protein B0I18_1059 [Taibaiella chishuiensis]|uniref:YhhN-like protein n=2 Tax=Taibaiella chishuiensis TaxID=1434707 RepID=A0A2P8D2M0_9BACT|nr:hypothetical protein B0I18_1059 [Taibaiella chishuiensis]